MAVSVKVVRAGSPHSGVGGGMSVFNVIEVPGGPATPAPHLGMAPHLTPHSPGWPTG